MGRRLLTPIQELRVKRNTAKTVKAKIHGNLLVTKSLEETGASSIGWADSLENPQERQSRFIMKHATLTFPPLPGFLSTRIQKEQLQSKTSP
jgi:hypothetical protein